MARAELSDAVIAKIPLPQSGSHVIYDQHKLAPRGFGVCVTAPSGRNPNGVKSAIFEYRIKAGPKAGRYRRMVIGRFGPHELTIAKARKLAHGLRFQVQGGGDPLGDREEDLAAQEAQRAAPTVNDLADRYLEWAEKSKRPRSVIEDRSLINQHVRRALGRLKVGAVTKHQVESLFSEIKKDYGTPVRAGLTLILLSKMFNLATDWGLRQGVNPVRGIKRDPPKFRQRYLDPQKELPRLVTTLDKFDDRYGIDAIRLLLLTGARRNEVLTAHWTQFDLEAGTWTKPAAATKQRRDHKVELSPPALQILRRMRKAADDGAKHAVTLERDAEKEKDMTRREAIKTEAKLARARHESPFLFPSIRKPGHPLESVRNLWHEICEAAELRDFRMHDLRHSFASLLLRRGHSLQLIGALLGHTQSATTERYAHVQGDAKRAAAADVGKLIVNAGRKRRTAEIIPLPDRQH